MAGFFFRESNIWTSTPTKFVSFFSVFFHHISNVYGIRTKHTPFLYCGNLSRLLDSVDSFIRFVSGQSFTSILWHFILLYAKLRQKMAKQCHDEHFNWMKWDRFFGPEPDNVGLYANRIVIKTHGLSNCIFIAGKEQTVLNGRRESIILWMLDCERVCV